MSDDAFSAPTARPVRVTSRQLALPLAGASVPAILLTPEAGERPSPAALLLHGYSSSKERLASTIGQALVARGIASLALDLPLHGARDDALIAQARSNPLSLLTQWRSALAEARAAIDWLVRTDEVDGTRIAALGYSLGSYIALITAAQERRVRAVIVAAGGDLPESPWTGMLRRLVDPIAAVSALNGRPLLMLHGRRDRTIPPDQAQRLFDAAAHPRELIWYDSGHVLPGAAAERAAEWLKATL